MKPTKVAICQVSAIALSRSGSKMMMNGGGMKAMDISEISRVIRLPSNDHLYGNLRGNLRGSL